MEHRNIDARSDPTVQHGALARERGGICVSVIVPAFNGADTLVETLSSVARQTHRDIEILIVDDGSTDDTARLAASFCEGEPRARVIRQSNRGVASARCAGIDAATGMFVAFIDADDLWHPEFVAACLKTALATHAALVFALYRRIDRYSQVLWSGPVIHVAGRAVRRMVYFNLVGNGSGLFVRRSIASAVGGYDSRLRAAGLEGSEDYLFQLSIAARHPIASVPLYLVGYRQHEGAMSNDAERMMRSSEMAIAMFRTAMPDLSVSARLWRWQSASTWLTRARYRLRRRSPVRAVAAAVTALWLDPVGTLAMTFHDACRLLVGRRRASVAAEDAGRAFADVDASSGVTDDRCGQRDWLARVRSGRLDRLAVLDRADRPAGTVAPVGGVVARSV